MSNRAGEEIRVPVRSNRYCCLHGVWYYKIRGGQQKGPFTTKREMEHSLEQYIASQESSRVVLS